MDKTKLYHGTAAGRWKQIKQEGMLKPARIGIKVVSMSTDRKVADYFANNSAKADKCTPVVLEINHSALIRDGYDLQPFSDPIWGEGKCDWECEVISEVDIPLSYVTKI